MANQKKPKYKIGYGMPPRHTQFQPGQSGNPNGRPKKRPTWDDDVEAELRSSIPVLEAGKPRRITKRRAIVKQHVNRAIKGDVKSTALLFNRNRQQNYSDRQDNLEAILQEFREKNARHIAEDRQLTRPRTDSSGDGNLE